MSTINSKSTKAELLAHIASLDAQLRTAGLAIQALREQRAMARRVGTPQPQGSTRAPVPFAANSDADQARRAQCKAFFAAHPGAKSATPEQLRAFA